MTLVNRTPHLLRIYRHDAPDVIEDLTQDLVHVIAPTPPAVRLAMIDLGTQHWVHRIPVELVEFGHAHDLPVPQPDTHVIVSLVVALALHHRMDLVFPYCEVRNPDGTVVGCRQLGQVC